MNGLLLKDAHCDFKLLLETLAESTLAFGSEFGPVKELRPLLRTHPGFEELAEILLNGMPYRYAREITEGQRENEVIVMLGRGNHKLAQDEPAIVKQLLSKDMVHGSSMAIPIGAVPLIPHTMVQPVGLAKQWALNEEGNRKVKYRITQDLSYSKTNKEVPLLINSRIDMDQDGLQVGPPENHPLHCGSVIGLDAQDHLLAR